MQPSAEEFEVVAQRDERADGDEDGHVVTDDEHPGDPQAHRAAQTDDGGADQLPGGDRRAQRSTLEFVEGVRAESRARGRKATRVSA